MYYRLQGKESLVTIKIKRSWSPLSCTYSVELYDFVCARWEMNEQCIESERGKKISEKYAKHTRYLRYNAVHTKI